MRATVWPTRALFPHVLYLTLIGGWLSIDVPPAWGADGSECDRPIALLTSLQGLVEVRRGEDDSWRSGALNQPLCSGGQVRTGDLSRAQIRLHHVGADPERDGTIMQLDENSALALPGAPTPTLMDLLRGAIHALSRTPTDFTIRTLFANAKVEGTEFSVRVDERKTSVAVLQGRVAVVNPSGELRLSDGEAGSAAAGQPPRRELRVKPRDAVQWTLYYPPILDVRAAAANLDAATLRSVLDNERLGRIAAAVDALNHLPEFRRDANFLDLRAALLLSAGQVERARSDLRAALALSRSDGPALALSSIIALTNNQTAEAQRLAHEAVNQAPESPVAHIAESYAYQSAFRLDDALHSARAAANLAPTSALTWARVAELELSLGHVAAGNAAAAKALALDAGLARTQGLAGFAALLGNDTDSAQRAFEQAIALDPHDPLVRLGMGLAMVRAGDLRNGRKALEAAANLDPNQALIRSYLGKAYYEEKRGSVASIEFDNAKALDPNDPTPWFYSAVQKQTENRPVEALGDLQKSIALNDNRAVYRSRLALDADTAARSANLARTYENLGFEQRSRLEAWKSTATDPTDFAAHRFLADSYANAQRQNVARVSELLQSQLLQPANIAPIQAELAEANLAILQGAGPSNLSFQEFNPLFTRNGAALQTNAIFGNNGTVGDDFVLSGIQGPVSGSFGQFHYATDGFRANSDLEHNIYNGFAQVAINPNLNIQGELRRSEKEAGDADTKLGPPDRSLRQQVNKDSARIGAHYQPAPGHHFLTSLVFAEDETQTDQTALGVLPIEVHVETRNRAYSGEFQYLFQGPSLSAIAGVGYVRLRSNIETATRVPSLNVVAPPSESTSNPEATNGYVYLPIKTGDATITVGASYDAFHQEGIHRTQANPKFGLVWNITPSTTLRGAAFRVLKRFFTNSQTLEPTQLGGFNQFFDDLNGTDSTRFGIGLDQRFGANVYGGVESSWRELTRYYSQSDAPAEEQDEENHRAYLYWTPHPRWALSAQYQYEQYQRHHVETLRTPPTYFDIPNLRTHSIPLGINYYDTLGFFARAAATYVRQDADSPATAERFWVVDASIGYRLPKRYGIISVEARNLLDEDFIYQNTFNVGEQQLARFQPERSVFCRINLFFH